MERMNAMMTETEADDRPGEPDTSATVRLAHHDVGDQGEVVADLT